MRIVLIPILYSCNAQMKENTGVSLLTCLANYSGANCDVYTDPMASTNATANAVATAASQIPVLTTNSTISLYSDESATITSSFVAVTDTDDVAADITFTIRAIPAKGVIVLNGNTVLSLNGTFTQSDINSSLITYRNVDGETSTDTLKVTISDSDGHLLSGQAVATSSTWTTINFTITNYCTGTKLTNAPFASASTGTSVDPHFICTATQLLAMDDSAGQEDDYFELKTDLDLTAVGMGLGIFSSGTPFIGSFIGNRHTLSNMTISGGGADDYIGLFRSVGANGSISNLILEDISVSGFNHIGGLIGHFESAVIRKIGLQGTNTIQSVNNGNYVGAIAGSMTTTATDQAEIYHCYVKSGTTVTAGTGNYVGGIVGFASQTSGSNNLINNNYSLATVTGGAKVGGILGQSDVGSDFSVVKNNYFAGVATASVTPAEDGGIIGTMGATRVNNVFNVTLCAGASCSTVLANCRGAQSATMVDLGLFLTYGWDFIDTWTMPTLGGYPILQWESDAVDITTGFAAGDGTSSSPYEISNKNQLLYLALRSDLWGSGIYFELTANIDFLGDSFGMIGNTTTNFAGNFNGQGYTISDYTVNGNADEDDIGTFGRVGPGGVVKNLILEDITVIGSCNVGGVVGFLNQSTVSQVGLIGTNNISSADNCDQIGGIVGTMFTNTSGSSIVRRSYTKGTTTVDAGTGSQVGGIVGNSFRNTAGTPILENNYSTATVTGGAKVGGILGYESAGQTYSLVRYNYFAGVATASTTVTDDGGIVGLTSGTLTDNYYDSTICDIAVGNCTLADPAGLPKSTADMKNVSTYPAGWDTATVWDFGFMPASYPQLLWETDTLPIQ